jgi:uncharacterized protein (DUF1778 family)
MSAAAVRESRIHLRASESAKGLIDRAAALLDQSMSRFVLDSAVVRAEAVIADQTRFTLSPEQMQRFNEALDAPLPDPEALRRLLARRPPWEA